MIDEFFNMHFISEIGISIDSIWSFVDNIQTNTKEFYLLFVASICFLLLLFMAYNKLKTKTSNCKKLDDGKTLRYIGQRIINSAQDEKLIAKCISFIQQYPQYINMPSKTQRSTLFQIACGYGCSELISTMLQLGADVCAKNIKNQNALYLAVAWAIRTQTTDLSVIKKLLFCGSPINEPSVDGFTPLMRAAASGRDDLVKLLLSHGADATMTYKNIQPWKFALKAGHESTAALLFIKSGTAVKHTVDTENINDKHTE